MEDISRELNEIEQLINQNTFWSMWGKQTAADKKSETLIKMETSCIAYFKTLYQTPEKLELNPEQLAIITKQTLSEINYYTLSKSS